MKIKKDRNEEKNIEKTMIKMEKKMGENEDKPMGKTEVK